MIRSEQVAGSSHSVILDLLGDREPTTADGQTTQLKLGIWRETGEDGLPSRDSCRTARQAADGEVIGVHLMVPAGSPAQGIEGEYGSSLVIPCRTSEPPEAEIRAALEALRASLRK